MVARSRAFALTSIFHSINISSHFIHAKNLLVVKKVPSVTIEQPLSHSIQSYKFFSSLTILIWLPLLTMNCRSSTIFVVLISPNVIFEFKFAIHRFIY